MGTLPVLPASPLERFRDLLPTTQKAIQTQYSAGCKLMMMMMMMSLAITTLFRVGASGFEGFAGFHVVDSGWDLRSRAWHVGVRAFGA